ncbi:MAG: PadR family transcriptional regulator [Anaerolineaceae bacterium]|nr:PadR family transcriptional regulator [Anaerolineaceae bacterium]
MEGDSLLLKWEESYKKGLLSFWILLLLYERPSYPFEMRPLIEEISQGTITADENSLYRALYRFQEVGIVSSETQPSTQGPDRRYYHLTQKGFSLLRRFIERNLRVFETRAISERIEKVCSDTPLEDKP